MAQPARWVLLRDEHAWTPGKSAPECLMSALWGIVLQNTRRGASESSGEPDFGQRLPSFRRHGQEMDFFREAECLGCLVDRAVATG